MKTILFVHDQQESPVPRQQGLERGGFSVVLLKSSQELMNALREQTPNLVLMDVLIEGKNGFEAALDVSQVHQERTFPLILCSAIYRTRQFREEARRCGAQDFILLPIDQEELLRRVNQTIAHFVPPDRSSFDAA